MLGRCQKNLQVLAFAQPACPLCALLNMSVRGANLRWCKRMHWIFTVLHAHEALQAFEPDPLTLLSLHVAARSDRGMLCPAAGAVIKRRGTSIHLQRWTTFAAPLYHTRRNVVVAQRCIRASRRNTGGKTCGICILFDPFLAGLNMPCAPISSQWKCIAALGWQRPRQRRGRRFLLQLFSPFAFLELETMQMAHRDGRRPAVDRQWSARSWFSYIAHAHD